MKKFALAILALLTGCYLNHYPVTPSVAEASTYKIYSDGGQGTAWAVNKRHVVTAGHMCQQMDPKHYMLVSSKKREIPAHMVEAEYGGGLGDLCVLETDVDIADGLIIADRMPKLGDTTSYVGYPDGDYTVSSGKYLGDMDGPDEHDNDNVSSAPTDHGASGSAVITPRGVVGVLVRARTDEGSPSDGTDGFVFIPLDNIKSLLEDAGIKYDTTPIAIVEPETNWGDPDITTDSSINLIPQD